MDASTHLEKVEVNLVQQHLRMVVVVQDDNGPVWDGGGIGRRVEPLVVPKEVVVKLRHFRCSLAPDEQ